MNVTHLECANCQKIHQANVLQNLCVECGKPLLVIYDLDNAKKQLTARTVLKDIGIPGDSVRAALEAVVPILKSEKLVADSTDPAKALSELIDASFAQAVIK